MEKNEKHENNKKMVGTAKGLYLLARNLTCKKISDLEKESTENPENFDMDFVRIVKNKFDEVLIHEAYIKHMEEEAKKNNEDEKNILGYVFLDSYSEMTTEIKKIEKFIFAARNPGKLKEMQEIAKNNEVEFNTKNIIEALIEAAQIAAGGEKSETGHKDTGNIPS